MVCFCAHVHVPIIPHSHSQLVQDQTYNTLSQASDLTKTKLLVDKELALFRDPGPSSVRVLHSLYATRLRPSVA